MMAKSSFFSLMATLATAAGCDMVIANGVAPSILYDIADGKPVGIRFRAKKG